MRRLMELSGNLRPREPAAQGRVGYAVVASEPPQGFRPVGARAQYQVAAAAAGPDRAGRRHWRRRCRTRAPGSPGRSRAGRSRACVIRSLRSPPRCHRLPRRRARPVHRSGCAGRRGAAADACHAHPPRPHSQNGAADARKRPPPGASTRAQAPPALSPADVSPAPLVAPRPAASPPPAARPAGPGSPRAPRAGPRGSDYVRPGVSPTMWVRRRRWRSRSAAEAPVASPR